MDDSAINHLAGALAAAVGDIETVVCDAHNDQHKYWYPSDALLFEQARPVMARYGLALIYQGASYERAEEGKTHRGDPRWFIRAETRWKIVHAESGEALELTMPAVAEDNGGKGFAAALTMARKLVIQTVFCIGSRDPDDDRRHNARPDKSDPAKNFEGWLDRLSRRALESDAERGTDYCEFLAAAVTKASAELGHEHDEVKDAIFFTAQQIQEGVFSAEEIAVADELACLRGTDVWQEYAAGYEAALADEQEPVDPEDEADEPPPPDIEYDEHYVPGSDSYGD